MNTPKVTIPNTTDAISTKDITATCNATLTDIAMENDANTGAETEQNFDIQKRATLDSINESWLNDISDMKITDNSNHDGSDTSSCYSTDNFDDSEYSANTLAKSSFYGDFINNELEVATGETSSSIHKDSDGLAALYLNEIEIDRSDEEQTITELVKASEEGGLLVSAQSNSMRVAFGVILRLVLPLANGVVRGIKGIRDVQFLQVLRNIASSRQALTNLMAFAANTISMNLSSVQVSHRLEPLLKLMKIRKSSDGLESLPDTSMILTPPTTPDIQYSPFIREPKGSVPQFSSYKRKMSVPQQAAPKCCVLNVLAAPPADQPIRADIVFIHGLHGSLVNTWKQGLWENERKPVEFQRPPKPPVRPPKRHRHSRSIGIRPPHKKKRARFIQAEHLRESSERDTPDEFDEFFDACENEQEMNDYTYICDEPKDIHVCDGVEYSFPSFRLRVNDNGRLLQSEIDSILNKDNDDNDSIDSSSKNKRQYQNKPAPKATANDPDYSKCWPGDWLPLDCPGVRVMALNYTTDQYLWRPLWKKKEPRSNLIQRSREMAELLINHRVGYGHPIIWVGHSKGGLFIKQIIVDAWESGRPAAEPFWRSSRGVFFYSVPHRGSHLASIKAPLLTRSVELLDIEKNSKYLLDLHRRFVGLYHLGHLKIEVFSFVETALTLMSVMYLRIVGVDSADPGIGDVCGIRLDHREICKPRSRDCILYKELAKMINKVC